MPDTNDLPLKESDIYLIKRLIPYTSAMFHHLTRVPGHLKLLYQPLFYPPTDYWSFAEKVFFFRALSMDSCLRPDLITTSSRTKSRSLYLGSAKGPHAQRTTITPPRFRTTGTQSRANSPPSSLRLKANMRSAYALRSPRWRWRWLAWRTRKLRARCGLECVRAPVRGRRAARAIGRGRDGKGQSMDEDAYERWRERVGSEEFVAPVGCRYSI